MDSLVPENCPSCNAILKWTKTNTDLICVNVSCSAQVHRSIIHFFGVIENIDGFGPSTITTLINNGYDSIEKIYKVKYNQLTMCGFGPKQSWNMMAELEGSLERPIPDYRFIAALGVNHLGMGNAKKLLEDYTVDQILFDLTVGEIIIIDGFATKTAESIYFELYENVKTILGIYELNFNIIEEKIEMIDSKLTDKRITFSGKMKRNRKAMEENAKKLGAKITGVNSKSDYLVIGEKVGQSKLNAAEKHDVKILTEQEYMEFITS